MAVAQCIAWDVALPAFQGPDEAGHFAYIQHLGETGKLPSVTAGRTPNSSEEQAALNWLNLQALTGSLGGRPAWSTADLRLWHHVEETLPPGSRTNGAGPNPLAKNPPLYYAAMAIPYRMLVWLPLLKRIFVLRLFSSLSFLATIILTWLIAAEVFGRSRWKQTLATAVVALQPQLAFMSVVINADTLLVALTTATLLAVLRLVTRGPSAVRVITASGLTAAAVLTHGRGLVTVPLLATGLTVSFIKHRASRREVLARSASASGAVGAAVGAYLLFGRANGGSGLYGGQASELTSGTRFNLRQFLSSIYQFYFPKLTSLRPRIGPAYGYRQVFIETFYGTFASLEVKFTARVYDALQVLSALGLAGLYTSVVVRWRRLLRAWHVVAVLMSLLLTTMVFLHYVSYRSLLGNGGSDPLIVGRYLLPMISLFGLAVAFTVGTLPRRAGMVATAAVLALGVLLSLSAIGITMSRFYA